MANSLTGQLMDRSHFYPVTCSLICLVLAQDLKHYARHSATSQESIQFIIIIIYCIYI